MSGRPKQRSRKYRARRLINSEQFWDLIRNGQNLPAISKAVDVPYRTLWGWINESDENRQRYDGARKEQDEMIRLMILDYEAQNLFKYVEYKIKPNSIWIGFPQHFSYRNTQCFTSWFIRISKWLVSVFKRSGMKVSQGTDELLFKGLIEMNDLELIFWPRRIGSAANIASEDLPRMNNSNEYWKA